MKRWSLAIVAAYTGEAQLDQALRGQSTGLEGGIYVRNRRRIEVYRLCAKGGAPCHQKY